MKGSWPDRHPAAAVIAGLTALIFMGMMLSLHPVAAAVMLGVGAAVGIARLVDRERDRRAALAARADRDYRALMAAAPAPLKWPPETLLSPQLPRGAVRSRRPADHWSTTEPLRTTR